MRKNQACAALTLCVLQDSWEKTTSIVYVTLAQMLCGIAKDLVKLGGKAVTKLVTPDERQGMLFSLVSYVTGFKNSMKGVGYLAGALMVGAFPAGTNSRDSQLRNWRRYLSTRVASSSSFFSPLVLWSGSYYVWLFSLFLLS
jgi:hypothetical protein